MSRANGDQGLAQATIEDYAVVVLDLMLPGLDGFAVCEELRRRERWAPVLMLTARVDVSDRIRGLDGGADDYMVKPFDFGELLARLRVLVRRGPSAHPQVFEIGDLHVDSSTRIVTRAGHQVELTAREFDVLEVLARNADRLVSRDAAARCGVAGGLSRFAEHRRRLHRLPAEEAGTAHEVDGSSGPCAARDSCWSPHEPADPGPADPVVRTAARDDHRLPRRVPRRATAIRPARG